MKALYIVGPTASGKTALSIELAGTYGAEIICADSQTIRRRLDIGTAKPSPQEMRGIKHHMIDIVDPYEVYSLGEYQTLAQSTMLDVARRGHPAIVVGGTGLYIDSLFFDFDRSMLEYEDATPYQDLKIDQLQSLILKRGYVLPENKLNKRHLINTLVRKGMVGNMHLPDPNSVIVGINPGRDVLIERINARVENMFNNGFVDEVRSIIADYGPPPSLFDAIGYRIVMRMLSGEITEDEAKELFKITDRQYAKRQMSWFKRNPNIQWFPSPAEAKAYILKTWLK